MTRFKFYTENPEHLVFLLRRFRIDMIDYCDPDTPRDSDGDCTISSLKNCGKCLVKWLNGELED